MTFSYVEGGFKSTPTITKHISIKNLVIQIQNNPHHSRIQYLRSLDKDSSEYKTLKGTFPCIAPHGTFNDSVSKENFNQFSGYIYFDIDNCDPESMKQQIILRYSEKVSLVSKSVGGRGVFFYVKVSNPSLVTSDNFKMIQDYLKDEVFNDLNIDGKALGIARRQTIPYDKNVYFNEEVSIELPESVYSKDKVTKGINSTIVYNNIKYKKYSNDTKYTFLKKIELVDIKECNGHIKWTTEYDLGDAYYVSGNIPFAKIFVPKNIPDGKKHDTYLLMVNRIVFNNPLIDFKYVLSFINYINEHYTGKMKMMFTRLVDIVSYEFIRIKETDTYKGIGKKVVMVNKNKVPKSLRQRVGAKAVGEYKTNKSLTLIKEGVESLSSKGIKVTADNVCQELDGKLGIATIKKYWRQVVPKNEKTPPIKENKTIIVPLTRKERIVVQIMGDGLKWSKKDLAPVAVVKDLNRYHIPKYIKGRKVA